MQYPFEVIAERSGLQVRPLADCGIELSGGGETYVFTGDGVTTHKALKDHFQGGKRYKLTWPRVIPPAADPEAQFEAFLKAKDARESQPTYGTRLWGGVFRSSEEEAFDDEGEIRKDFPPLVRAAKGKNFAFEMEVHVAAVPAVRKAFSEVLDKEAPRLRMYKAEGCRRILCLHYYPGASDGLSPLPSLAGVKLPEFIKNPTRADYSHLEVTERPPPMKAVGEVPAVPRSSLSVSPTPSEPLQEVSSEDLEKKFGEGTGKYAVLGSLPWSDVAAALNSNPTIAKEAVAAKAASKKGCAALLERLKRAGDGRPKSDLFRLSYGLASTCGQYLYLLRASMSSFDHSGPVLLVRGVSDAVGCLF